jgi:DNA-binding transcriptional LysR family regulator
VPLTPSFPSLRSLELFCSVVELGSISRAAREHRLTQPSASARLRDLERSLGVLLLSRTTRGSTPTEDGLLIAEWARTVLDAAYSFQAGADALSGTPQRGISVAASFTIAEFLLPAALAQLKSSGHAIELQVMNSSNVLAAVRDHRAGLGFIESPAIPDDLRSYSIGGDELCVVVHPTHPWTHQRSVSAEVLASSPVILREPGSGTRESLDRAMSERGLDWAEPMFELGSTTAIKNAALQGIGPAVVSALAVKNELRAGDLVAIAIDDLDLERDLQAVWHREMPESESRHQLIVAAQTVLASS